MKFSQFLLGMVALGWAGLALALDPVSGPVTNLPVPPAPMSPGDLGSAPLVPLMDGSSTASQGGFFAGVGLYVMQAYFQNNVAYTVLSERDFTANPKMANPNTVVLQESAQRFDVSQHMNVAPQIWFGYENADGFGARVRYWYLDEGTTQSEFLPPFSGFAVGGTRDGQTVVVVGSGTLQTLTSATPQGLQAFGDTLALRPGAPNGVVSQATTLTVTTKLELQVFDVEAFQRYRTGAWDFLLSGGVRLAQLDQAYNAYNAESTSAAELRTLASSFNFNGAGPTLSLEVRRALGNTGLTAYTSARGALVIGTAQQNVSFGGLLLRNDDPNPQFASQHWDRGLPIGELELGVEFNRRVGPVGLVGQIALVGQEWFQAGNASRSQSETVQFTPRPVIGGAPDDSDLSFFGLAVRFGVDF